MTTYVTKNYEGATVELFTDDTYTLAIGSYAGEYVESTPVMLARDFDSVALGQLLREARTSDEQEKLMAAWKIQDQKIASGLSRDEFYAGAEVA
jgi:hypothetical protein